LWSTARSRHCSRPLTDGVLTKGRSREKSENENQFLHRAPTLNVTAPGVEIVAAVWLQIL
jgi:hypothetical protein